MNKFKYLTLFVFVLVSFSVSAQQTVQVDDNTQLEVNNNTVKIDTTTQETNSVTIPNIATNTALLSITSPTNGITVANTQLTIIGKSPAGVLVDVTLTYVQSTNVFNANAEKTYIGTVTSDQNGSWAFVPSKNVPDGKYEVYGTFEDSDGAVTKSETVSFYVTSTQNNLLIIVTAVIIILFVILIYLALRKLRTGNTNLQFGQNQNTPFYIINSRNGQQASVVSSLEQMIPENTQVNNLLALPEQNQKTSPVIDNLPVETALNQEYNKNTSQKILDLLKNNPNLTRNDLAKELDITADGVKYHLKNLESEGKLVHEGSRKTGYWVVKA